MARPSRRSLVPRPPHGGGRAAVGRDEGRGRGGGLHAHASDDRPGRALAWAGRGPLRGLFFVLNSFAAFETASESQGKHPPKIIRWMAFTR